MINKSMDALAWLRKQLETEGNDLLREMIRSFAESLMSAEADVLCGAAYGTVSAERTNIRNGYRHRDLDTRVGTIDSGLSWVSWGGSLQPSRVCTRTSSPSPSSWISTITLRTNGDVCEWCSSIDVSPTR